MPSTENCPTDIPEPDITVLYEHCFKKTGTELEQSLKLLEDTDSPISVCNVSTTDCLKEFLNGVTEEDIYSNYATTQNIRSSELVMDQDATNMKGHKSTGQVKRKFDTLASDHQPGQDCKEDNKDVYRDRLPVQEQFSRFYGGDSMTISENSEYISLERSRKPSQLHCFMQGPNPVCPQDDYVQRFSYDTVSVDKSKSPLVAANLPPSEESRPQVTPSARSEIFRYSSQSPVQRNLLFTVKLLAVKQDVSGIPHSEIPFTVSIKQLADSHFQHGEFPNSATGKPPDMAEPPVSSSQCNDQTLQKLRDQIKKRKMGDTKASHIQIQGKNLPNLPELNDPM